MNSLTIIISVLASIAAVESKNYCDLSCKNFETNEIIKNIGCDHNGLFDKNNCEASTKWVDITKKLKQFIVEEHNQLRNLIAGGGFNGYAPACRMGSMEWDDNLAYLAGVNIKHCLWKHDACYKTDDFEYPAQNLADSGIISMGATDYIQEFNQTIHGWFNEQEKCTQSIIDKFPVTDIRAFGHFTVQVTDRNIRVGCAAATYDKNGFSNIRITCHFAAGNMQGFPIYEKCNKAGEKCKTGPNKKYPNLCSPKEFYDVNNFY